jgi:RimJ/RimL family protein N-acetyltransferase
MSTSGGQQPLSYRRIGRADLGVISTLELEQEQVERFLGPIDDIVATVRNGLAHVIYAIDAADQMVGFYVVHPDRRDTSCWWLGWFAIDCRQQGHGYGRRTMAHIMDVLHRVPGCRRVRLYVDSGNANALHLYQTAGFRRVGLHTTGELILESAMAVVAAVTDRLAPVVSMALPKRMRRKGRVRLAPGPHATFGVGVERGPPCRWRLRVSTVQAGGMAPATMRPKRYDHDGRTC